MPLLSHSTLASASSVPVRHAKAPLTWEWSVAGNVPGRRAGKKSGLPARSTGSVALLPSNGPQVGHPVASRGLAAKSHARAGRRAQLAERVKVPATELVGEVICVLLWAAMIPGLLWLGQLAGLA